jgi:D-threo-aldose 1-dehydrogenase
VIPLPRLGLGGAPLGNLFHPVDEERARATVEAAWRTGIRLFDTAPHYGLGTSELRLGQVLRGYPRDEYVLSTKVGRLLVPDPGGRGDDLAHGFAVPATHRRVWDLSADGVRRSLDESLTRLGLDRVDIALLHDPEESPDPDGAQAYPALERLRQEGVVRAIGVGSKDPVVLHRFAVESDVDVLMVAGRYTLLDQRAAADLLPACQARGIAVLNVGAFNSGLLAVDDPDETRTFEYAQVRPEPLRRARAIAAVCREHGVALPHAALAFARAHPAVSAVVVGADTPGQVKASAAWFAAPPPPEALWRDLAAAGLLPGPH